MVDEEGDFESGAWKLDIDDREEEEEDDEEEELEEDNYVDVGDFSEDDDGEERESEKSKQAGQEQGDPFRHDDEEEEASALSPTTGRVDPNRLLHIGKTWKVSNKTTYQEFFQKSFFPSHLKCQAQKRISQELFRCYFAKKFRFFRYLSCPQSFQDLKSDVDGFCEATYSVVCKRDSKLNRPDLLRGASAEAFPYYRVRYACIHHSKKGVVSGRVPTGARKIHVSAKKKK